MHLVFTVDSNSDLMVKKGQKVNFNDPLTTKKSPKEVKIPLSSILKISSDSIFKSLKKFVGDQVKKGELIAEYKGILSTKRYHSEFEGIIKEINHNEGIVIIETLSEENNTKHAFFKGDIININEKEITLEVANFKEYPLEKTTDDFGGETLLIDKDILNDISEDIVNGKIIITEKITPYQRVKIEALGGKGFIVLTSEHEEIPHPVAILKQAQDLEKIKKIEFPYCIVSKKNNKIYFYV